MFETCGGHEVSAVLTAVVFIRNRPLSGGGPARQQKAAGQAGAALWSERWRRRLTASRRGSPIRWWSRSALIRRRSVVQLHLDAPLGGGSHQSGLSASLSFSLIRGRSAGSMIVRHTHNRRPAVWSERRRLAGGRLGKWAAISGRPAALVAGTSRGTIAQARSCRAPFCACKSPSERQCAGICHGPLAGH